MENKTKVCSSCGKRKKVSDYQKRSASKDGLTASCKACLGKRDSARYKNDPRIKARHKAYAQTDAGKKAASRAKKNYVERNLIKRAVHVMVGNAVRDGRLCKPSKCEQCGSAKRLSGHHDDYAKPLEVRWLCSKCHNDWHKENGEGKNAVQGAGYE